MPYYLYQHPITEEIREVFQHMNDQHVYFGEPEDGSEPTKWKRIFTVPLTASNSTEIDPFSYKDFEKKTKDKNMTFGEIWDKSKELSEKRAKLDGVDNKKIEYFNEYSKKRKGMRHPDDKRPSSIKLTTKEPIKNAI